MKKLLIILTAITLTLSTVLVSACSKGGGTANVSDSSVSAEESSSSSANASRLPQGSRPQHSENPTESSAQPDNSQSQGGADSSGSDKPYVPGDPYFVDTVVVPDGVSNELWAYLSSLNSIGEINGSNYAEQLVKIENYLAKYETLTPEEKAYVTNIESLRQAREVCKQFEKQGIVLIFNEKYASLPDAQQLKNADIPLVEELGSYILESYENYGYLAANVEDFAAKKTKIQSCVERVNQSTVEITAIAQDTNCDGKLEGEELNGKYTSKTGSTAPFQFNGVSDNLSVGKDASHKIIYSDKNNTNVEIWHYFNGNLTFTAPRSGTLTLVFRPGQSRVYTISLDGEQLGDTFSSSGTSTIDTVTCVRSVPAGGDVAVTASGGTAYIYAVKFSYADLGE